MVLLRRRRANLLIYLSIALFTLFYLHSGISSDRRARSPRISGIQYRKSSYDWSSVPLHHVPEKMRTLPTGKVRDFPNIQHNFAKKVNRQRSREIETRRVAVVKAFRRSWNTYVEHAWTWDEVAPVSGEGRNTFGGWAASLVDSLDTLWIMGMRTDFRRAVHAVAQLDWTNTTSNSIIIFETTIRHLGGLLSAYDLSGEPTLLAKAVELGDMLYMGFDTPNRMPPFWLSFSAAKDGTQSAGPNESSAAGCSLAMEFTRLSQLTNDPKYYDAVERVKEFLLKTQHETMLPGMWPIMLNYRDQEATGGTFTINGEADSLYEYLPKMYALLGGLDREYERLTVSAFDVIKKYVLFRPMVPHDADILIPGSVSVEPSSVSLTPEAQHLGCFAGGMFAFAGKLLGRESYVLAGEKLTRGCVWAYKAFPTGVMPERMHLHPCNKADSRECAWNDKIQTDSSAPRGVSSVMDSRYLLRPEAVESVFYMYRVTGDEEWRDMAWDMFQAIERATQTQLAYSAISDVNVRPEETQKLDSMESFWFAETLKYLYLIFCPPDVINLDDWIFNTEAHPFKRPRKR